MSERNSETKDASQKKWYSFYRKRAATFRLCVEAYSREQAEAFVSGLSVENSTANRGWRRDEVTDTTEVLTWRNNYGFPADYQLNEEGQEVLAEEENAGDGGQ